MKITNAVATNKFGTIRSDDLLRAGCTKSRVLLAISNVNADTTGTFTVTLQKHLRNGTANAWLAVTQRANTTRRATAMSV